MISEAKPWYVYLVRCRGGSLYCGISDDVDKRIEKHNAGKGAKFTATRRPVELVFQEKHTDQTSARRREMQIKKWTKDKKEELVAGFPRLRSG